MASGPTTLWEIDGETVETVTDFLFLGSKNHCGWWLQPWNQMIASWQEIYDKPSVLKSRDITLLIKVWLVKAMVFPVVMYGCESWTMKKAEHQRIDAFKLWCWGRLLKVSWTTRRSKQSILNEIIPEYSWKWCWSWNSSILVIWCEQTTHWKSPWCWERSRVEEEEGVRGWDGWMASSV